jgi:hypothetical protein
MNAKYLGEVPIDVTKHDEFSEYTPTDWAMYFIESYGQIDGDHHKAWVLDQVARILKGTPVIVTQARWDDGQTEYSVSVNKKTSKKYKEWVLAMKGDEYDYDEGIAP